MLRDDSGNGGGRPSAPRNVLGDRLDVCSMKPKTGFFRDGCCNTSREDVGSHTVCVVMTPRFSSFPNPAAMISRRRCPNSAFRPEARRPLVLVCAPLARSAGGGLRAPRGLRATHEDAFYYCSLPISSVSPWTSPDFEHGLLAAGMDRHVESVFRNVDPDALCYR